MVGGKSGGGGMGHKLIFKVVLISQKQGFYSFHGKILEKSTQKKSSLISKMFPKFANTSLRRRNSRSLRLLFFLKKKMCGDPSSLPFPHEQLEKICEMGVWVCVPIFKEEEEEEEEEERGEKKEENSQVQREQVVAACAVQCVPERTEQSSHGMALHVWQSLSLHIKCQTPLSLLFFFLAFSHLQP